MLLYQTTNGIARGNGDLLEILDLPPYDIAELLTRGIDQIRDARVIDTVSLRTAKLLTPVEGRGRIILNGANYVDHVKEAGMPMPDKPLFLDIPDTGLCPPFSDIVLPAEAPNCVDYEGELALVITRPGHNISKGDAWHHVGGLSVANDVSARDVQLSGMKNGVMVDLDCVRRGKSFPTFSPIGPGVLVTMDADQSVSNLGLLTTVNVKIRQIGRISEMIFDIPTIVEHVSQRFELKVGDVILTGTPGGVGLATGSYLVAGDVIEVSIDGIGVLRNTVVAAH
jgi:2-keto-4-pentenoate hydratase/2-oxohepta-3-ene-1,7-dioic acid hydratase in catechol pathway